MEAIAPVKLSRRKLKSIGGDIVKSAEAIDLMYVTDGDEGIRRVRKGKGFTYKLGRKTVTDAAILHRIRSLVLPPAWEEVWICTEANGHLQATGYDVKHRKQYRYHPDWHALRSHTKFYHLYEFGKVLPNIRERLAHDLAQHGLPQEKVLATVVSIMQQTGIRIGNGEYEKLYGSFGLSTLKDKHVTIKGGNVQFSFKGKKGVYQNIALHSRKLAAIVKNCRDIPGKELFQYYDAEGKRHAIDSGMVNAYIKEISKGSFTAKDFRTWTGTVQALLAFKALGCCEGVTEVKKRVVNMLDTVAAVLGNTRTVCKKYYVHPGLIDLYECQGLEKYLKQLDEGSTAETAETVLMQVLAA